MKKEKQKVQTDINKIEYFVEKRFNFKKNLIEGIDKNLKVQFFMKNNVDYFFHLVTVEEKWRLSAQKIVRNHVLLRHGL